MIFGIGTDIVSTARLQTLLERYNERVAGKILADEEWPDFQSADSQAHFLAKRFAVKEAASKAMGTGFRDGLRMRDIFVRHNVQGKPELCLSGQAKRYCTQQGISGSHVSVSDEQDFAVAFVIFTS